MAQITRAFRQSALRRGILVAPKSGNSTKAVSYAAAVEFANLGFVVEPSELLKISGSDLAKSLIEARKIIGADRDMTPIYPGFPQQVQELSTLTLLVEQILHYWSNGVLLPDHPREVREALPVEDMLRDARELRVLPAALAARELILELSTSRVALSEDDRNLLESAMELQHPDTETIAAVAASATHGENLQSFLGAAYAVSNLTNREVFEAAADDLATVDQLLRAVLVLFTSPVNAESYKLAVENLSDRDSWAVHHGKFPRSVRRTIVERLGKTTQDYRADRLLANVELWRGIMRAIHPYDFKLSEDERRAVDIIHGNIEYRTLNSLVEEAMASGDVLTATRLLKDHQPGNLLRRLVALLRLTGSIAEAVNLANAVFAVGSNSAVSTLISAYNGVISANDDAARVTRVAGRTNTMVERKELTEVDEDYLRVVSDAVRSALRKALESKRAPEGVVGICSDQAVPLVRRDASTADRVLDRGQSLSVVGDGHVLRIFGHWRNNQNSEGYMDIGAVVLDEDTNQLAVCTWDSWNENRSWSTYSGDKLVLPGDSAAEFVDVDLKALRESYPGARYVAMAVQSWSGWPIADVDFIAGAMLRETAGAQKGEVFDARTVTTAFKPTTSSTQSVPLVVDLERGAMVWLDSSSGSKSSSVSSSRDDSIAAIVYDELKRPRFSMGELAELWAEAHGAEVSEDAPDRDALLSLL